MKTKSYIFFSLLVAVIFFPIAGFSQCCASGCSMSGTKNFGVLQKNSMQAISFYKHNYSDTYYKGSSPYFLQYVSNSYWNYAGFNLSYGITEKLTSEIEMGYFINKTQNYYKSVHIPVHQLTGSGLSDLSALMKYNFYNSSDTSFCFTAIAGAKIPTGEYQEFDKGVKLPREVQSGKGAYSIIFGLNVKVKASEKTEFLFGSKMEWNFVNPEEYQHGISNAKSLSTNIKIYKGFSFLLATKYESVSSDYMGGTMLSSTGYRKILAMPGLVIKFGKEWEISTIGDLPIYQQYNGIQFAAKYAANVSLSKQFQIRK